MEMYSVGLVSFSGLEEMDSEEDTQWETLGNARTWAHKRLLQGAFTAHVHGPDVNEVHTDLKENCDICSKESDKEMTSVRKKIVILGSRHKEIKERIIAEIPGIDVRESNPNYHSIQGTEFGELDSGSILIAIEMMLRYKNVADFAKQHDIAVVEFYAGELPSHHRYESIYGADAHVYADTNDLMLQICDLCSTGRILT